MASTFSTSLKLELIGNGDQSGTWGTTTNINLGTLLEQAITGVQAITMSDVNYPLVPLNGVSDEPRNAVLVVTGTNTDIRNIIAPAVEKLYVIKNNTSGGFAIVIKTNASTGVTIPNGSTVAVYCDGTEFYSYVLPSATANTANTLALRDGSGNFSAGTITANLTGNVTGVTTGAHRGTVGATATLSVGSFVIGNTYTIATLGTTTNAQWNTIAGTSAVTYVVGSTFTCANIGTGLGDGTAQITTWTSAAPVLGGMTLLGTLTGNVATRTLSGLDLTSYKQLYIQVFSVSHNNGSSQSLQFMGAKLTDSFSSSTMLYGFMTVDLLTGRCLNTIGGISFGTPNTVPNASDMSSNSSGDGFSGVSTVSTSINFSWSGTTSFDAGTINVYGVK